MGAASLTEAPACHFACGDFVAASRTSRADFSAAGPAAMNDSISAGSTPQQ